MDAPGAGGAGSEQREPRTSAGLSLDRLTKAFAAMLGTPRGETPAESTAVEGGAPRSGGPIDEDAAALIEIDASPDLDHESRSEAGCRVDPSTILEAMLFVGMPDGGPVPSARVAALIRGMNEQEIDSLATDLAARYLAQNRPYEIVRRGSGWIMRLRQEFERFGSLVEERTRAIRLDESALDILATVAWNQPVGREALVALGCDARPSMLAQLVRRGLLAVEKDEAGTPRYRTTPRFLEVFRLESLTDLPRPGEPP
jgi:segregation and condensation protein B